MKKMNWKKVVTLGLAASMVFGGMSFQALSTPVSVMAEASVDTKFAGVIDEIVKPGDLSGNRIISQDITIKLTAGTYTNVSFDVREGAHLTLVYEDGVVFVGGGFSTSALDYGLTSLRVVDGIVSMYGASADATMTIKDCGTGIFIGAYYENEVAGDSVLNIGEGHVVIENSKNWGIYKCGTATATVNILGSGIKRTAGVLVTESVKDAAYTTSFEVKGVTVTGVQQCGSGKLTMNVDQAFVSFSGMTTSAFYNCDGASTEDEVNITDSTVLMSNNVGNGFACRNYEDLHLNVTRAYLETSNDKGHGINGGFLTITDSTVEAINDSKSGIQVRQIIANNSVITIDQAGRASDYPAFGTKNYLNKEDLVSSFTDSVLTVTNSRDDGIRTIADIIFTNTDVTVAGCKAAAIEMQGNADITFDGKGISAISAVEGQKEVELSGASTDKNEHNLVLSGSLEAIRTNMTDAGYAMNGIATVPYGAPVNANNTMLNRFAVVDSTGTIAIADANGKAYTYSYQLNDEGVAYVWAPVSVVYYDATEGTLSNAAYEGLALTADDGSDLDNEIPDEFFDAADYTVEGNAISLVGHKLPTATKEGFESKWMYIPASESDALGLALQAAAEEDYDTLNAILDEVGKTFTERTALDAEYVYAFARYTEPEVETTTEPATEVEADEEKITTAPTKAETPTKVEPSKENPTKPTEVEADVETEAPTKGGEVEADTDVTTADRTGALGWLVVMLGIAFAGVAAVTFVRKKNV